MPGASKSVYIFELLFLFWHKVCYHGRMTKIHYTKASFILSAAALTQLPPDKGCEVAIVGRSNCGKSSVLNQLTRNKQLARVSKTPGRTQLINLFQIDETRRIVDLPGYGYANVPLAIKNDWSVLLTDYLSQRQCLRGLILVMDIRHPLKETDRKLILFSQQYGLPIHILLNKADKLSKQAIKKTLTDVTDTLSPYQNLITLQAFSAMKGQGLIELETRLNDWFNG